MLWISRKKRWRHIARTASWWPSFTAADEQFMCAAARTLSRLVEMCDVEGGGV